MLYRPLATSMIRDAWMSTEGDIIGGDLEQYRSVMARRLGRIRAAYHGGDAIKDFLVPKEGESHTKYMQRVKRLRNVRIVAPIVDVFARMVYGTPPERTVWAGDKPASRERVAAAYLEQLRAGEETLEYPDSDPVTAALSAWFSDTYAANHHASAMVDGMQRALRDGWASAKVWPHLVVGDRPETFQSCRFQFFEKAEDVIWITDPDDGAAVVGVVEVRSDRKNDRYRLWVPGQDGGPAMWWEVGPDLTPKTAPSEWWAWDGVAMNLPPFVRLSLHDGSWLGDAVSYQASLINKVSQRDNVLKLQGHAQLWSTGKIDGDESVDPDGNRVIKYGEGALIQFIDDTGSLQYASPGAPVDQHLEAIIQEYGECMRAYNMPADYWKDTGIAERPLAKRLSWISALIDVTGLVADARRFERELAEQVIGMAAVFRDEINALGYELPAFDTSECGFEIRFRDNPLPTERSDDEAADLRLLDAGLITPIDFWYRRPGNDGLDPEIVARRVYMAERESAKKKSAAASGLFGGAPPLFGGGE